MIWAQGQTVECTKARGIVPKRQVLDNVASKQYKQDQGVQHGLPTHPTWWSSNAHSREGHPNTEGSFRCSIKWHRFIFPCPLWCQTVPQMERQLNLLDNEHLLQSQGIYLHRPIRPARLQLNALHTNWKWIICPRQTRPTKIIIAATDGNQHVPQTLSSVDSLVEGY